MMLQKQEHHLPKLSAILKQELRYIAQTYGAFSVFHVNPEKDRTCTFYELTLAKGTLILAPTSFVYTRLILELYLLLGILHSIHVSSHFTGTSVFIAVRRIK